MGSGFGLVVLNLLVVVCRLRVCLWWVDVCAGFWFLGLVDFLIGSACRGGFTSVWGGVGVIATCLLVFELVFLLPVTVGVLFRCWYCVLDLLVLVLLL